MWESGEKKTSAPGSIAIPGAEVYILKGKSIEMDTQEMEVTVRASLTYRRCWNPLFEGLFQSAPAPDWQAGR